METKLISIFRIETYEIQVALSLAECVGTSINLLYFLMSAPLRENVRHSRLTQKHFPNDLRAQRVNSFSILTHKLGEECVVIVAR